MMESYYFVLVAYFYINFYHIIVYYILVSIPNDKFCRVLLTDTPLFNYGVDDVGKDEDDDVEELGGIIACIYMLIRILIYIIIILFFI